jgi:hypothetical protein
MAAGGRQRYDVLDPTEEASPLEKPLARGVSDLEGKVVGVRDISTPTGDILLTRLEELLTQRYGVKEVLHRRKPTYTRPAPEALREELASRGDVSSEARADGGSCTSGRVHDGIACEERQIPTAVVATEVFLKAARAQAQALGRPGFTVISVPHPVQNLTPEEVRQRADSVMEDVVRTLGERAHS